MDHSIYCHPLRALAFAFDLVDRILLACGSGKRCAPAVAELGVDRRSIFPLSGPLDRQNCCKPLWNANASRRHPRTRVFDGTASSLVASCRNGSARGGLWSWELLRTDRAGISATIVFLQMENTSRVVRRCALAFHVSRECTHHPDVTIPAARLSAGVGPSLFRRRCYICERPLGHALWVGLDTGCVRHIFSGFGRGLLQGLPAGRAGARIQGSLPRPDGARPSDCQVCQRGAGTPAGERHGLLPPSILPEGSLREWRPRHFVGCGPRPANKPADVARILAPAECPLGCKNRGLSA